MLNTVFYIIDQLNVLHAYKQEDGSFFSLLIDTRNKNEIQEIYNSLCKQPVSSFSLTLHIQNSLSETKLQQLTSFFFNSSYLKVAGKPVIILAGASAQLLKNSLDIIVEYIKAQGFEGAHVYLVMPSLFNDHSIHASINNIEELKQRYGQMLYELPNSSPLFFYNATDEDILKSRRMLLDLEEDYKRRNPLLYESLLKNRLLEKRNEQLKYERKLQKNEISTKDQHIYFLKSNHAAKELQEYYNNEYELLPGWYKRFGHLLKVIMGKRTLSSLFSDKVKKYK